MEIEQNEAYQDKRLRAILKDADRKREVLNKESEHLNKISSVNHDAWDKQLMTTSILALGFSFSFLNNYIPIRESIYTGLFYLSAISFVATIIIIALGFNVADYGYTAARKFISLQTETNERVDYLRRKIIDTVKEKKATNENDKQRINELQQQQDSCKEVLKKVQDGWDTEGVRLNNVCVLYANRVISLNNSKSYSFISGILLLTSYVIANG